MKRIIITALISLILVGCGQKTEEVLITPTPVTPQDTVVSFVGVGDNLIHEMIYLEADKMAGTIGDNSYDFKPFYENIKPEIQAADVAFINQETILGGVELTLSGYPSFNSPSEVAKDMYDLGFNMFNLSNNHALDMGDAGIKNTLATFGELDGIICNGIYDNEEDSKEIAVLEKNGIRIALLSYTYQEPLDRPDEDYRISYFDKDLIQEHVNKAKELSDVIIVSAHWGQENAFEPNEFQKEYAQLFADLGVNVVLGTHSHTIQPIEWIKGAHGNEMLVTYSLGNFMGSMLDVDNILSGIIHFDIVKDSMTKDIYIENAKWTPLVIHYEGNPISAVSERYGHQIYKLKDYTEELAQNHVLNGYEGQVVDVNILWEQTKSTIPDFYLSPNKKHLISYKHGNFDALKLLK